MAPIDITREFVYVQKSVLFCFLRSTIINPLYNVNRMFDSNNLRWKWFVRIYHARVECGMGQDYY